jgi:fucose permease
MKPRSSALLVGIAFLSFVALGLPGGLLGVAWPSIRTSFALPLDAIGALLMATTAGYLLSSSGSGRMISALGVGRYLTISSIVAGVGLLGYSIAPRWWAIVTFGLLTGAGGGAIDAGLNTYFSANHSASLMNWLHACYGIGATLGPAIMTVILDLGHSWRWGYVLVVVFEGLLASGFALTQRGWKLSNPTSLQADPHQQAAVRILDTLRVPAVWAGIALFVVFTGLEGSGGQWPYTLFTEGRSVDMNTAGLWVSVYWGSLTVGRILFGIVADRIGVIRIVRACMLGSICGAALLWWNLVDILGFLGLALIGFSLAPIFPLMISDTPRRVGGRHAANAIGFQIAGAGLGLAALPGLAGILAENVGLETIGPFLFALAVVMYLLHEVTVSRGTRLGV